MAFGMFDFTQQIAGPPRMPSFPQVDHLAMGAPPPRVQLGNFRMSSHADELANFQFDFAPMALPRAATPQRQLRPGPARGAIPKGQAVPTFTFGDGIGFCQPQEERGCSSKTPVTPITCTPSSTPATTPPTPPPQSGLYRGSSNFTDSTGTPRSRNVTMSGGTPRSGSTTPRGRGIVVSEKGHQEILELMHNKDKLRQVSTTPFQEQHTESLGLEEFCKALRSTLAALGVALPSDSQLQALFEKHGHGGRGVRVEDFEALLFRLLCFMRAHEEVDVTPRQSTPIQQRDRQWRQECISTNPRQFEAVYEVQNKLGQGNFGTVYQVVYKYNGTTMSKKCTGKKAKDSKAKEKAEKAMHVEQSSKHTRVCKVISKELAQKAGLPLHKVREELLVLKHLDHPHTLRIFESFEDESSFFLIMETALGGDLNECMCHMGPTDAATYERWAAKVMYQTLSAISYCHQRGVVHKDLKLENVMLSTPRDTPLPAMHVVVVDFGLSEVFFGPYDRSNVVSGTPPYMAPEVWTGNSGQACDLWSCGVMLFFMLSGRFPFHCQTVDEFKRATALHDPDWSLMGGASKAVHHLCKDLLLKSDVFRPAARKAMKHVWFDEQDVHNCHKSVFLSQAEIDSLLMLPKRTAFDKFLCRLVATQLDAGKQTRINDFFHALDASNKGILSKDNLARGLLALGITAAQAEQVAQELDVANHGAVSYTEFLAGFLDLSTKVETEQDEILWLAWQQFSPNENAQVKANDVQNALAARGMTVVDLPPEFLLALKKDASGYLTFDWFKRLLLAGDADLTPPACDEPKIRRSGTKRLSWLDRFICSMSSKGDKEQEPCRPSRTNSLTL